MANQTIEATIAMLEKGIEEAETKIRGLRAAINTICAESGLPQRYADEMLTAGPSGRLVQIQDDTFYGKKQTTAMREYLDMRKAQNLGPAKPRDLFEALKAGGYQFEAKDDETALVGLRSLLRTQPNVFHRLPQGTYGLTAWYPDAKRQKDENGDKPKEKKKGSSKKPPRPARSAKAKRQDKPAKASKPADAAGQSLKVVQAGDGTPPKDQKAA